MKRATAIRHLVELAAEATDGLELRERFAWSLEEMWVTGELLGLADSIDRATVVLMFDLPPEEMPWLALNREAEWVSERMRLGKRPVQWFYRPLAWPPWNAEHRRLVRFWTATDGVEQPTIDALESRRLDRLTVVEPSVDEFRGQLERELHVARAHLRSVLDGYWEREWRRQHGGTFGSPDDHLWRAGKAVTDLADTLDELDQLGE